jgi:hypothetical protein
VRARNGAESAVGDRGDQGANHHRNDTWNTLTEQLDQHPRSQDQVFRWPIVLRNSGLVYLVLLA